MYLHHIITLHNVYGVSMLSAMLSAHDVDALELVIHLEHALLAAGLGEEPHHHGGVVHLPNIIIIIIITIKKITRLISAELGTRSPATANTSWANFRLVK